MILRAKPFVFVQCLAACALFVSGCGHSGNSVDGIVQFSDGVPVQSGSIEFRSLPGGTRYAGHINEDGSFKLTDQKGVRRCPPGEYEVVVVQIVLTEDLAADAHTHGRTVPRRYADYYTSGLRTTKSDAATKPLVITLDSDAE